MTKIALLANLQIEQEQWEALLTQLGESRMDQPGVAGEWSIKDGGPTTHSSRRR